MNTKNNFFLLLLITVIFIFFIIFLELYARYNNPSWHQNDSVLGWNLKRNFSNKYIQSDFKGNIYEALLETNKYSLRFNKNVTTTNPDILVIGDSFVADPYASNDKMWFSILADQISKKENNLDKRDPSNVHFLGWAPEMGSAVRFPDLDLEPDLEPEAPDEG